MVLSFSCLFSTRNLYVLNVPNLFYVDGESKSLDPNALHPPDGGFMWSEMNTEQNFSPVESPMGTDGQTVFNVHHKVPWHWPVSLYMVTKGIAAGLFILFVVILD